jgi:hypothetical protein
MIATAAIASIGFVVIPSLLHMRAEDATHGGLNVPYESQSIKVDEVTARPNMAPLTRSPFKMASHDATASDEMRAIDKSGEFASKLSKIWQHNAVRYAEFERTIDRIKMLSGVEDGWKGPGSKAPSTNAKRDALALLRKIVSISDDLTMPGIGLDEEGVFTLSWFDAAKSGCISVYGDGTYSFFMKSRISPVSKDEESIGRPLNSGLIAALLS